MRYLISATPVCSGKVIPNTRVSVFTSDMQVNADQVGRTVMGAVYNARRDGWHMDAPNTFVRVEFQPCDEIESGK